MELIGGIEEDLSISDSGSLNRHCRQVALVAKGTEFGGRGDMGLSR